MLDVAAVFQHLLRHVLPEPTRQRLFRLLPGDDKEKERALLFIVSLHDYGKATPTFQRKIREFRKLLEERGFSFQGEGTTHHGDAGYALLHELCVTRELRSWLPYFCVSTAHHHRQGTFPGRPSLDKTTNADRGKGAEWARARVELITSLETVFGGPLQGALDTPTPADLMLLAGLISVADWLGSDVSVFEYVYAPEDLHAYWATAQTLAAQMVHRAGFRHRSKRPDAPSFQSLFPFPPRPLQKTAELIAHRTSAPALHIVEAPMGEGKTEAALLLAHGVSHHLGAHGFYVGMPTKATANQFLERTRRFLDDTGRDFEELILAHGDASMVQSRFQSIHGANGALSAKRWFHTKKHRLLAPYGVGTIDQALTTVMQTKHQFVGLAGLAGKTVILDEVHAYDDYTGELLVHLVHWLGALDVTVVLLSATLPKSTRNRLLQSYASGRNATHSITETETASYPRITTATDAATTSHPFAPRSPDVAYQLRLCPFDDEEAELAAIADTLASQKANGACIGYIANTVARAQRVTSLLSERGQEALLVHARIFPQERLRREQKAMGLVGPASGQTAEGVGPRPASIIVGTQVLEQSLDLDFDLLLTDVAPIDLLLQRMGRLHRHQRPRPKGFETPIVEVLVPTRWQTRQDEDGLKRIAGIYDLCVLRATLIALHERSQITLPSDIDDLVSTVYDPLDELRSDDEAAIERYGTTVAKRQLAQMRLLPNAQDVDFLIELSAGADFGDMEDPTIGERLRADTRLGDSLSVVCLTRRDGAVFLSEEDTTPLDLEARLTPALLGQLANRSISVSRRHIVENLRAPTPENRPTSWEESALLRHRRLVLFENGEAQVAGETLRLDDHLGLVL